MILGNSLIGVSTIQNAYLFSETQYNSLKIYGDAIIDKVYMSNEEESEATLLSFDPTHQLSFVANTTLLFSEFDNDLQAGELYEYNSTITAWMIYRRKKNPLTKEWEDKLVYVDSVEGTAKTYSDYMVANNTTYKYEIVPSIYEYLGQYIETNPLTTDIYGWYLIDNSDKNNIIIYRFDIQVESQEVSHVTQYTMYQNYTRFPSFSQLDTDFKSSGLSCIVAKDFKCDGSPLFQPQEFINQIEQFINNKKAKILKTRKGEVFPVRTTDFKYKLQDETQEQVTTISFNYIQIGEV